MPADAMTPDARTPPPLTDLASADAVRDALQAQACAQGVSLRAFPPPPDTCCERGCAGCVWESWLQAVGHWRDEALLKLSKDD